MIGIADHVKKLHNSIDKIDRNAATIRQIRQMQSKLDQYDEENRSRNIM